MASEFKDFLESFRTREGQRGFVTALLIVITILTAYSWIWSIQFQTAQADYWVSASKIPVLNFPSDNPQYFFYTTGIGEHAGSVNITVQELNGWYYSGTFFLHDTVSFGNWKVQIEEINMDRPINPIHLSVVSYVDGRPLLTVIFFILLVVAFLSGGTKAIKKTKKPKQEMIREDDVQERANRLDTVWKENYDFKR
jgi:hypothetical protein